jgi:ATP-dependent RNA helicase DDX41
MVAASIRGRSPSPHLAEEEELLPSDYKAYVPVAKRRAQLLSTLGSKQSAKKVKVVDPVDVEVLDERKAAEQTEERAREKARRERTLLQAAQEVKEKKALQGGSR